MVNTALTPTRLLRLAAGIFLYAVGICFTLNANIGYSPWDVFHWGLASTLGISFGLASIITGLAIVTLALLLKEKVGLGTFVNLIFIGIFVDIIRALGIMPTASNMVVGTIMLIAGLFIISLGTCLYMSSALGSGPRDSMMVALRRKTKLPSGVCRIFVESCAVAIGWLLGGFVGIGTLISVLAIGVCIQISFRMLRFDPTAVRHESIDQTFRQLFGKEGEQKGPAESEPPDCGEGNSETEADDSLDSKPVNEAATEDKS